MNGMYVGLKNLPVLLSDSGQTPLIGEYTTWFTDHAPPDHVGAPGPFLPIRLNIPNSTRGNYLGRTNGLFDMVWNPASRILTGRFRNPTYEGPFEFKFTRNLMNFTGWYTQDGSTVHAPWRGTKVLQTAPPGGESASEQNPTFIPPPPPQPRLTGRYSTWFSNASQPSGGLGTGQLITLDIPNSTRGTYLGKANGLFDMVWDPVSRILRGRFRNPGYEGPFELKFSADFMTFRGWYRKSGTQKQNPWRGQKV
jgi:hypothetical protein